MKKSLKIFLKIALTLLIALLIVVIPFYLVIKLVVRNSEKHFEAGILNLQHKDYPAAISNFNAAVYFFNRWDLPYNARAVAKFENGDYQGALKDNYKSIELNPTNAVYFGNCGATLELLEEYSAAATNYAKAIELNPKSDWTYSRRAALRKKIGDYAGAAADISKILELNPKWLDDVTNGVSFRVSYEKKLSELNRKANP